MRRGGHQKIKAENSCCNMKKILLVEDDIALSAGLCFELEEEDYLTVAAHSLKKAGQLLETSKFDLLLLDVDLPDGNGFTFYKEIKKRYTVPVIDEHTLTVNMTRLRKKIEDTSHKYIQTIYGMGYLFARGEGHEA